MGIFNNIKTKVNKGINKGKAWCKKHPVATKVIAGGTAALAVTGAALGVYAMTQKHEDEPEVTTTFNLPEIPEVPQIEEPKEEKTEWQKKEEEDNKVAWARDKEDWQKIIDVADTIDSDKYAEYEGYHVYKLNDDWAVARVDDNYNYHYKPETVADEPTAETTEEPANTEAAE